MPLLGAICVLFTRCGPPCVWLVLREPPWAVDDRFRAHIQTRAFDPCAVPGGKGSRKRYCLSSTHSRQLGRLWVNRFCGQDRCRWSSRPPLTGERRARLLFEIWFPECPVGNRGQSSV